MLLPRRETNRLSEENYTRLQLFYSRFCEGPLHGKYGLGHLVYACHAAFPLILTPELANLIWVNFNRYLINNNEDRKINPIAVSDFLLSSLCHQISHQQYEVIPEIRAYLLYLLNDGAWFRRYGILLNGAEHLHQLAEFLRQYIKQKQPDANQETTGFRQLNEWAALAFLNPQELAGHIGKALVENKYNNQGQLWLNTQMERFENQFSFEVHNNNGNRDTLRPFYNLYHYTQARKNEIFSKGNKRISEHAQKIESITSGDGKGYTITMPLSKAIADRTNRKLNKVQRILSLLIGIDEYSDLSYALRGCTYGARHLEEALKQLNNGDNENNQEGYATDTYLKLYNQDATKNNILGEIKVLFANANPEDICLIYFAGHGENGSYQENTIIPVDYTKDNSVTISNKEFLSHLHAVKNYMPCKTVFILDSHTGYYNWLDEDDIFIGGVRHTSQTEQPFDTGNVVASAFLLALTDIIRSTKGKITYRHLLRWLRFKVEQDYGIKEQTPVLQTNLANLDNYFLRTDSKIKNDAPVIAYHKATHTWQLLEEDFKVMPLNVSTQLRDYETDELVKNASGELFVEKNIICFGGNTNELDKSKLYRTDYQRELLDILFEKGMRAYPDNEKIRLNLEEFAFDWFSKWEEIQVVRRKNLHEYSDHLVIDSDNNNYIVHFTNRDKNEMRDQLRLPWIFSQQIPLVEFLDRFTRYYYFLNLHRPAEDEYYKKYAPLNVTMLYSWADNKFHNPRDQHQLILSEEAFNIIGGSIEFKQLSISIQNKERFPVFCELYLVVSSLVIKKVAPITLRIMPGESMAIGVDERKAFEEILTKGLTGQLKLLTSRDPHQIDFSQTGITQQSIYRYGHSKRKYQ
jgi:hypothetical protein